MKIAIGTAQFGLKYGICNQSGRVSAKEVRQILDLASSRGVDTIDTAIGYGESESTLGKVGINGWKVVSKLPEIPPGCLDVKSWIYDQITNSLNRLNVKSLDTFMLHRPSQLLDEIGPLIYQTLQQLKLDGLTKKIGVSIYTPEELPEIFENRHFDIVQAPFSLLDRRLLLSGWMKKLKSLGVELHVRSIFLQGLLLISPKNRMSKFALWDPVWNEWDKWLKSNQITPLEACIRYALSIGEIDKIVVGVDSLDQLSDILKVNSDKLGQLPEWPLNIDHKLMTPSLWGSI
jgi:aryl-alcohol dehydrogenase-like predicted oxidoreductase